MRTAGKRGLNTYVPGAIKLRLADVINRAKLPALPKPPFGHVTNRPPTMVGTAKPSWGMLGNNAAGDCVVAGACHETMLFAMATGKPVPRFTTASALADYSRILVATGNKPYNQLDPSTDLGLDAPAAAAYRRDTGLVDADGNVHKVDAYALLDNIEDLYLAIYLFGAAGVGLALPESAETEFEANKIWDDTSSAPMGGHYVPAMAVNRTGNVVFSTWSDIQGATPDFVTARWQVGIAYLSKEYMTAKGVSPEAITWDALQTDLQQIASNS